MNISERILSIRVNSKNGRYFLHKPLLVLYALGQCFNGRNSLSFVEVDRELLRLFEKYYPDGLETKNTHYPFGRLETDKIWCIDNSSELARTSVGHLLRNELIEKNISAGFCKDVFDFLSQNKQNIIHISESLIKMYLPDVEPLKMMIDIGISNDKNEEATLVFLIEKYIKKCRYQSLIATANTMRKVVDISTQITEEYANFQHWLEPDQAPAPSENIHVDEFCYKALLADDIKGLVIIEPEQWFYRWSPQSLEPLWSNLAEHYGRYPVIVVTKSSVETLRMSSFFTCRHQPNPETKIWVSRHEPAAPTGQ